MKTVSGKWLAYAAAPWGPTVHTGWAVGISAEGRPGQCQPLWQAGLQPLTRLRITLVSSVVPYSSHDIPIYYKVPQPLPVMSITSNIQQFCTSNSCPILGDRGTPGSFLVIPTDLGETPFQPWNENPSWLPGSSSQPLDAQSCLPISLSSQLMSSSQ